MARGQRAFVGRTAGIAALLVAAGAALPSWGQNDAPDLTAIGLEAVMNMEVTSVSKRPERLMDAAAAIYVITSEEIHASGATSIPELLRLVPGVQVARVNSSTWAIGVRGFTSTLSRSLLVLIDGRSVYSPLFAGVYWDVQDTLLEDIDRIEVIRGPGATLWGANAVNGVINIITKSAQRTQGTFAAIRAGDEERLVVGGRYGGETSGGVAYRAYAKYTDRDAQFHATGPDFDDWQMARMGFRLDAERGERNHLTAQGDAYDGKAGRRTGIGTYAPPFFQIVQEDADLSGGNLLGRWEHRLSEGSDTTLQFYYDRTHRREPNFEETRDTFDVEFRHHARLGTRHNVVWGAGYRVTSDATTGVPTVEFIPADRTDDIVNAFAQDEIQLVPSRWTLTVGSKFENNDYSGFEWQPNVRVLFTPSSRTAIWAAVSRAVRVPSRLEHDLAVTGLLEPTTPTFFRIVGTKEFGPEELIAYELGYRVQATEHLFLDVALFRNDYDDLLSIEPGMPFLESTPPPDHLVVPFFFANGITADVQGGELAFEWRPGERVKLAGSYSFLDMDLAPDAGSLDSTTEASTEGSSPRHMAKLGGSFDLPQSFSVDAMLRHVSSLPSQQVASYTELEVSVTRRFGKRIEVSLVGQNLLSPHHPEFAGGMTEIERSIYGKLVGRW